MRLTTQIKPHLTRIKALYRSAFPRNERVPFFIIRRMCKAGKAELFAIESSGGHFGGFAVTARHGDIVMLSYFAIHPMLRGRGIGSRALQTLMKRYADSRFILEIEAVDEPCDNLEVRQKRREFYLKNGLKSAGFTALVFNSALEILTAGEPVSFEEYRELYRLRRGSRIAGNVTLRSEQKD